MSEAGSSILTIRTFGWTVRPSQLARLYANIIGRYLNDMKKSVYTGCGQTLEAAFQSIWELMKYTDDFMCRKIGEEWEVKLSVIVPTDKDRNEFE